MPALRPLFGGAAVFQLEQIFVETNQKISWRLFFSSSWLLGFFWVTDNRSLLISLHSFYLLSLLSGKPVVVVSKHFHITEVKRWFIIKWTMSFAMAMAMRYSFDLLDWEGRVFEGKFRLGRGSRFNILSVCLLIFPWGWFLFFLDFFLKKLIDSFIRFGGLVLGLRWSIFGGFDQVGDVG